MFGVKFQSTSMACLDAETQMLKVKTNVNQDTIKNKNK